MKTQYYSLILISLFVFGAIPNHVIAPDALSKDIVFDYSHGQRSSYINHLDQMLAANLTDLGYVVIFAKGGINSSILSTAVGLILGSIYGVENGFTTNEVNSISSWFNVGGKFMWVGYDSDYGGQAYISGNMTQILEKVGSHVYGESSGIEDPVSNCKAPYRPVATGTSSNPEVSDTGTGVDRVLLHSPTLLYGSNSENPSSTINPVALENTSIPNVYPILYYSEDAIITDYDFVPPVAHFDGQTGAFVATTIELRMGPAELSVLIVSGASPYGDYQPMCTDNYYDVELDGMRFVKQVIEFAYAHTLDTTDPIISVNNANSVAGFPILVNATITDSSEITDVLLFYSTDEWETEPTNTTMTLVSGKLWRGEIPWLGYNIPIQYTVTALDAYGNLGVSQIKSIRGIEDTRFDAIPLIIAGVGAVIIVLGVVFFLVRSSVKQEWSY